MLDQKQEANSGPQPDPVLEELRLDEILFQLNTEEELKYFDESAKKSDTHDQEQFTSSRTDVLIKVDFKSPSEREGLKTDDEIVLRRTYAGVIKKVGVALSHPNETINLAQNIFQRFYLSHSFLKFDCKIVCVSALMIACKVTSIYHQITQLVSVFHLCFKGSIGNSTEFKLLDSNSLLHQRLVGEVMNMEINVLHALGYELQRLNHSSHKFLLRFLKILRAERTTTQIAWNYANDTYMSRLCVSFPGELIALSSIWLAYKATQEPAPDKPWWMLGNYRLEKVEECAKHICLMYQDASANDALRCEKILQKLLASSKDSSNLIKFTTTFDMTYSNVEAILNRFQSQSAIKAKEASEKEKTKPEEPKKLPETKTNHLGRRSPRSDQRGSSRESERKRDSKTKKQVADSSKRHKKGSSSRSASSSSSRDSSRGKDRKRKSGQGRSEAKGWKRREESDSSREAKRKRKKGKRRASRSTSSSRSSSRSRSRHGSRPPHKHSKNDHRNPKRR